MISCSSASPSASRSRSRGRSRRTRPFAFSTAPFVCWRDPIWYRDRVGRREPARPQVHQGRGRTWGLAGRVLATRTVTRAEKPASSETGSWTRLPPSSASTSPSTGSTSTRVPPARASPPTTTTRAWRGPPALEAPRRLGALVARRRQLLEMLVAERNRRHMADPALREGIDAHLRWLGEALDGIERALDEAVRARPVWRGREELL